MGKIRDPQGTKKEVGRQVSSADRVAILCDFDGTICHEVVIDSLYAGFAACGLEFSRKWERGEITTPDEITSSFATVTASREELEAALGDFTIDPGIHELLAFCRQRGYEFAVVSDGLDWYIRYILELHGVRDVSIYANQIEFTPQGFRFEFPWHHVSTPLRGVSKPMIVQRYRDQGAKVVVIGDGLTDVEAAAVADQVYAQGLLIDYCRQHGIPAVEVANLVDVVRKWQNLKN